MMLRYSDIIKATTDAAEVIIDIEPVRGVGVALQSFGALEASEEISIEQMGLDKNNWEPVTADDAPVVINSGRNRVDVLSRGTFKITKPATTSIVGVRMWYAS